MNNQEKQQLADLLHLEAHNKHLSQKVIRQQESFFKLCKMGMFGTKIALYGYKKTAKNEKR